MGVNWYPAPAAPLPATCLTKLSCADALQVKAQIRAKLIELNCVICLSLIKVIIYRGVFGSSGVVVESLATLNAQQAGLYHVHQQGIGCVFGLS